MPNRRGTPCGCPVGGARVGHLRMGRHRGLPLPDGAMQWQTVGATPCGCPVGSARVGHLWMGGHRGPPLPVMVHGKP
jgi:hypothetical protein